MVPEKTVFANQIKEGQTIEDIFLVKEMSRAETRSGKPYIMVTLMDRTGEIPGRIWENADDFLDTCEPGNLVQVTGLAQAFRGVLQLKIDNARETDKASADISHFLQGSKKNITEMAQEITTLAKSVQDPFCRKLLLKFFNDSSFLKEFQFAPAAKSMHHAYLGGLLEHTLAVSQLAVLVADFYPALDRDLLLSGALLHDIGKTKELAFASYPFEYTDRGRLVGHLVLPLKIFLKTSQQGCST
jgi:3'-5' exoribonuclease